MASGSPAVHAAGTDWTATGSSSATAGAKAACNGARQATVARNGANPAVLVSATSDTGESMPAGGAGRGRSSLMGRLQSPLAIMGLKPSAGPLFVLAEGAAAGVIFPRAGGAVARPERPILISRRGRAGAGRGCSGPEASNCSGADRAGRLLGRKLRRGGIAGSASGPAPPFSLAG